MDGKTLLLPAPSPAAWLAEHVAPRLSKHDEPGALEGPWHTLAELVADDGAVLRAAHDRLLGQDVPGPAAATYVVGWFAGNLAWLVGFGLGAASAGFVVDPTAVRFRRHPDGWCDRVEIGAPTVVVAECHPWAGQPDVEIGDPVPPAVGALVAAARPLVEACHGLAKVGLAGLWNEVGDGLGSALSYEVDLTVDDRALDVLRRAGALAGVPWRARCDVRVVDSRLGPRYVSQKGGCCLAYTEPGNETEAGRDTPHYCGTCSFRTWDDVVATQIDWLERELQGQHE